MRRQMRFGLGCLAVTALVLAGCTPIQPPRGRQAGVAMRS